MVNFRDMPLYQNHHMLFLLSLLMIFHKRYSKDMEAPCFTYIWIIHERLGFAALPGRSKKSNEHAKISFIFGSMSVRTFVHTF